MKPSPIEKAEALLAELEAPRPPKERAAWAIGHEAQSAECIRDLLQYQAGYAEEQAKLASLAARLLAALAPLLAKRPDGGRHLIDEYVEGMAPRLRVAARELKAYLEQ